MTKSVSQPHSKRNKFGRQFSSSLCEQIQTEIRNYETDYINVQKAVYKRRVRR